MSVLLYEDPKIKDIKSKLKKMRIAKGYTQESLADLSGVNIKSLSLFEQRPEKLIAASTATVYKLADSLGVDIDDIINKENIKDE